MVTRADIVSTVADMLARSDLDVQIGREVERAVEHYNRVGGFFFQEARAGTFTTVSGQQWYASVDFTSGGGPLALGPVSTANILTIDYASVAQNATSWPLDVLKYADFELFSEPVAPTGVPDALTRYSGQIGLWPVPNGPYQAHLSARLKSAVPTADGDTSVWFDSAREAIELRSAWRTALNYVQDEQRAIGFATLLREAEGALSFETARQSGTGRIRPTCF